MTSPNLIGGLGAAFDLSDVGDGTTPVGAALRAALGLSIAATASASATLVVGKFTPVDATAAAPTMTLPTGAADGASLAVEKIDATTNAVSVTGNIRGVPATTITLVWQHETLLLRADSAGSWWPVAGHKTKASLDVAYANQIDRQSRPAKAAALKTFRTSLASRSTAPCDVAFVGHSFIDAIPTSSYQNKIHKVTVDGLRTRFPVAGVTGGYGYLTRAQSGTFADDPITVVGASTSNSYGLGRKAWLMTAAGNKVTYTNVTCDAFDLFYLKGSGNGIGYYTIDGGTAVTFNTNNATFLDGVTLRVTGLTAGPHTIEVGWSSGGLVGFLGLGLYNGDATKGIRSWNAASNGSVSSFWVDASHASWIQNLTTIQPSLIVFCGMANDWYSGSPLATAAQVKTNIQTLFTNIRAAVTTPPSFVIAAEWQRGDGTGSGAWADYVQAAYDIAAADPAVAVYEMGQRFGAGPFASGTTLISTDKVHPTTAGVQFWADNFVSWLVND